MESEAVVSEILSECVSKVGLVTCTANIRSDNLEKQHPNANVVPVIASKSPQANIRSSSPEKQSNPSASVKSVLSTHQSSKVDLRSSDPEKCSASAVSVLATNSSKVDLRSPDTERQSSPNRSSDPEKSSASPVSVLTTKSSKDNLRSSEPERQSTPNASSLPAVANQSSKATNQQSDHLKKSNSSDSVVSVLATQSQSSQVSLVSCDVCQKSCQRAVSLPCCQSQSCRACAVKYITTYRGCWGCGKEAATMDIKIELGMREAVKMVVIGMTLEAGVRKELEMRKKARDELAKRREYLGLITNIRNGIDPSSDSMIDISDADKAKQDKAEEDDNQDHRWKPLRETHTDKERVLLAKKMFSNAVESDPNRNLSFHGFRSRCGLKKGRNYRNHLQESSFEINSGNLDPLPGFKKVKRHEKPKSIMTNADLNFKKEKIKIQDIPEVMKEVFLKQLQDRYGEKYTDGDYRELKRFVKHYVSGFKETADFFSFYNLGKTEKQVSRERLEEMVDIEKLLGEFSKYYGDIEKTFCKECLVEHRF